MKLRLFSTSSWLLPLISALITLLIYLPGLNGDFEFDDGPNILDNAAIKIETMSFDSILAAALSGKSGPFGRSISMLSFAGNYYFTQLEPFFFKLTNVLIHIFAGLGVYVLTRQLTLALDKCANVQRKLIHGNVVAITTASVWLVHPLNVTSVLYVVQRMTSLAALFTFWSLVLYVFGRRKTLEGDQLKGFLLILAGLGPLTGLALMSKENGALAPYLMLCIELIIFRFVSPHKGIRFFLYALFLAMVLIPIMWTTLNFDRVMSYITNSYTQREFSLTDRLLTQPKVLMFYLRLLVLPNAGVMGIYHDDFPLSRSLTESISTLFSIGGIFAFLVGGIFAIRRAPALAIGIFWFLIGHSMESTFLALEMVHEHRNYLPIVGPIFALAYYFWHPDFKALSNRVKWCALFAAVGVLSAVTFVRSVQWSNVVDHAAIEVHNHPNSDRANYSMGRIYFMLYGNEPNGELARLANQYFARAAASDSNSIYPLAAMIQMAYKVRDNPDPAWIETAVKRLRYARPWAPNMVALNNLVNCQMTQYCRFADDALIRLLVAALDNPDASLDMKATAHSLLGGYYAVKLGNLELGMTHIKAAAAAEPNRIEYRLDLMRIYEVVNELDAARAELDVARRLDIWGLQKERLDSESALLDSAFNARTK